MPTVSLQMIVKDEFEAVASIVEEAIDYVDAVNLTVSDKTTANKLKKIAAGYNNPNVPRVTVVWRSWTDRFDEARNANLAMCKTDFFFWLDADDTFDFAAIPQLVEIAAKNNIDAIFLPYNYAQDDQGNCITRHWRERLIRMGKGFEWRGWVHETCISDQPRVSHKVDEEVTHHCDMEHARTSVERNHAILEKAYDATNDPRYLHYLGMSHFTHGDYQLAAETLSSYLEVSGSIEDTYRAMSVISECAYHLGQHDIALEFATKCATLKPEYPMAFWLLAQYEADQSNWNEALEWVKVSQSKPDPQTLSVYDPSARGRATLIAAQALFMLGRHNEALKVLRTISNNPVAQDLLDDFQKEADAETFIALLPKMRKFFDNDQILWESLCHDIKYDARVKPLRNLATSPSAWPEKSIVIFCGQGYEEWGPHTLDKGMGGSEEAIVYLAPELSKLGYDVTVYAEADVTDIPEDDSYCVRWRPWQEIDTRDQFNIFVAWRAPQFLEKINAKVKLADIHDVLPEASMKDYPDVTYLVKSAYHRSLAPALPDEKIRVIGNGIKKEQFK